MRKIETVSLIGLGAIGASYLDQIANTIPLERLRVIADGERAARYREHGTLINGQTRRFHITTPDEAVAPADLLIFATKHHQLAEAIQAARGHVGPDTVILSLLNGIVSEEEIARTFPRERILYSLCVSIDAVRVGNETTSHNLGKIKFGERKNPPDAFSANVLRVREFFDRTGIPNDIPEDMLRALWWKFMINVGCNQLSAVLRTSYSPFQREGVSRQLLIQTMEEVLAVSAPEGIGLTQQDVRDCVAVLDAIYPLGKTSMLQDVEAQRPTEVEIFAGTVIRLGHKHGIPVPLNEMLYRLLRGIEETYPRA